MQVIFYTVLVLIFVSIALYTGSYIYFSRRVKNAEDHVLTLFGKKISKIPALIESMRPYVVKNEAFSPLTDVHTKSIVESQGSVYDILIHNSEIQRNFLFLMQLSQQIPELQKQEYFLYIRDFIIDHERDMKRAFHELNTTFSLWNRYVHIKNMTLIGYLLPGKRYPLIDEQAA